MSNSTLSKRRNLRISSLGELPEATKTGRGSAKLVWSSKHPRVSYELRSNGLFNVKLTALQPLREDPQNPRFKKTLRSAQKSYSPLRLALDPTRQLHLAEILVKLFESIFESVSPASPQFKTKPLPHYAYMLDPEAMKFISELKGASGLQRLYALSFCQRVQVRDYGANFESQALIKELLFAPESIFQRDGASLDAVLKEDFSLLTGNWKRTTLPYMELLRAAGELSAPQEAEAAPMLPWYEGSLPVELLAESIPADLWIFKDSWGNFKQDFKLVELLPAVARSAADELAELRGAPRLRPNFRKKKLHRGPLSWASPLQSVDEWLKILLPAEWIVPLSTLTSAQKKQTTILADPLMGLLFAYSFMKGGKPLLMELLAHVEAAAPKPLFRADKAYVSIRDWLDPRDSASLDRGAIVDLKPYFALLAESGLEELPLELRLELQEPPRAVEQRLNA